MRGPAGTTRPGLGAQVAPLGSRRHPQPPAMRRPNQPGTGCGCPPFVMQPAAQAAARVRHDMGRQLHCASAAPSGSTGAPAADGGQAQRPWPPSWSQLPSTARVAFFTGSYITLFGVAGLLVPGLLISLLFPASPLSVGWMRVGATLMLLFGAYYAGAAVDDAEGRKPSRMYQATVLGRALLALIFSWLVVTGQCGPGLLLLAAANAAGAWRMACALRSDGVGWGWAPRS